MTWPLCGQMDGIDGYATTSARVCAPLWSSRDLSPYTPAMGILTADDFEQAFSLYFKEMDRCVAMGCYWALLHVLLALPDVCAALESPKATVRERYTDWCRRYLNPPFSHLTPEEFWELRNAILHQGQALGGSKGRRYSTFSFATTADLSVHGVVIADNITLHPQQLVSEMKSAIRRWFADLRDPSNAPRQATVKGNLRFLVREQMKEHPTGSGIVVLPVQSST